MSGNKRAGHSTAVPWDSHGRRVYLTAQHRVSSVLGPTGCSAPGWFCLPRQRQLLLEESPRAFDLRLPDSLSHLERGVQAWLPGDLPTLPQEGLGSSNPPSFPTHHLLTRASVPTLSCDAPGAPGGLQSNSPTLRLGSWSFSSPRVSSTVLTRSTTQPGPRHRTHTQPQATLPTTEQILAE